MGTFDRTDVLFSKHQMGHKKGSMVSFSSQLNIQHQGGIHDTVILDELIDKSAAGGAMMGNRSGLFHDTSQVLIEETLINDYE